MRFSNRICFLVFLGFGTWSSVHAAESAFVPLKSDQSLPYTDMYAFSYSGSGMEALWLLIPPYLQGERDLSDALFQLISRGMTAELLKTPIPDLPTPAQGADGFERKMQLQVAAALGLLSNVRLFADYGTALTTKLKEKAVSDPGSTKLKQKMLMLGFSNGNQAPLPVPPIPDTTRPPVYEESVSIADIKGAAMGRKLDDLERILKSAVDKRQMDVYSQTVSKLLAIQEEGLESDGRASRILAGYHSGGILRGFPADQLVGVVFPTSFLASWDSYDLIDLNKIIMLSGTSKDRSALTAGFMLIRAAVEKNPDERYLVVSEILGRLQQNESVGSLVLDVSKLSYFGSTPDQVNGTLQDLMKLWKQ